MQPMMYPCLGVYCTDFNGTHANMESIKIPNDFLLKRVLYENRSGLSVWSSEHMINRVSLRSVRCCVMVTGELPFSQVTLWQRQACDRQAADTKAGPSSSLRPLRITSLVNSPLLK